VGQTVLMELQIAAVVVVVEELLLPHQVPAAPA
jgi:hypothetical protein